jgi:hypothetical protein
VSCGRGKWCGYAGLLYPDEEVKDGWGRADGCGLIEIEMEMRDER